MVLKTCRSYKNIFDAANLLVKHVGRRNGNWQDNDLIGENTVTTSVTT